MMGKISSCSNYTALDGEEGLEETDEMDCLVREEVKSNPNIAMGRSSPSPSRIRSSPSSSILRNGIFNNNNNNNNNNNKARQTLFDENLQLTPQYDIEAVKLEDSRSTWGSGFKKKKRQSISSEESLSDFEELGAEENNHIPGRRRRRESGGKGLWEEREIEAGLRSYCFSTCQRENIFTAVDNGDLPTVQGLLSDLPPAKLGPSLLLATWRSHLQVVRWLLSQGAPITATDLEGRTCLHLAACTDNVEVMQLLLDHKAAVNVWDSAHQATPLFCAAVQEDSKVLPLLLDHGADINLGLHEYGLSALHCAVKADAIDNVSMLLRLGAVPNSVVLFSETPLHTAASMGYEECVKLLLQHGAGTEVLMGASKSTALHLAAQDGNVQSVQHLLGAGANAGAKNGRGQTGLHLASLSQSPETVDILLKSGADPDCEDTDRRTPLHSAIVKGSRSYECVRLLLDAGADVNHQDSFGYSPLHIAALNEYSYCASLLLSYGADITTRTNGGTTALSMIVRKIPSVLPKFEDMLDHAITLADHDINDVDCELKLDFKVLIPNKSRGESSMFMAFIETGHNHLLKHPLCESFLHLKWLKVRKFFFISLIFHLVFTILHTTFVIQVFSKECILKDNCKYPNVTNFSQIERIPLYEKVDGNCFEPYEEQCRISLGTICVWVMLLSSTFILVSKELFQLMHSQRLYFLNWENWVQWGIIINVVMVSFHKNPLPHIDSYSQLISRWQHHAAAVGVFFVWGELMLMVGRLPTFGIYVQMFTTVAKNFSKFLGAYFCLIVAFALSFTVLFPNYQSFNVRVVASIVKTLVMMAGEIEYENFMYENGETLFPFTGHLMILLFVIFISIILMNLLVGLAVSDIQGLQKCAGLTRLVRQTELISHIESMLFTRLLHFLPKKFLEVLHQEALVVPHAYNWAFTIRPNDLREDRLPKDIIENVHWLISRRHRSRKRRPFSRYTARRGEADHARDKSFIQQQGEHEQGEEQLETLAEIKNTVRGIQEDNGQLRDKQEQIGATMETVQSQLLVLAESIQQVSLAGGKVSRQLSRRIQRSVREVFTKKQIDSNNDGVKDLFEKLAQLAIAITEEKKCGEEAEDTVETEMITEGGKYERKFGSLEKKLKRTNLMKRRESHALLEGVRRTRGLMKENSHTSTKSTSSQESSSSAIQGQNRETGV